MPDLKQYLMPNQSKIRRMMPGMQHQEVQWVALTQDAVVRIQAGNTSVDADPTTKRVYRKLAEMGGRAEVNELSNRSLVDPSTIQSSLDKLENMGLVAQ